MPDTTSPVVGPSTGLASVVERNISALVARAQQEQESRSPRDRLSDAVTRFTGSLTFVAVHLLVFGGWLLVNSGLLPLPRFDPTFVILATVASVEAIFLSTFVLITQNRCRPWPIAGPTWTCR